MNTNNWFKRIGDELFAISNARHRNNPSDIVLLHPLDTRELEEYRMMVSSKMNQKEIFQALFPPTTTPKKKVKIDFNLLRKEQVVQLINAQLGTELPTLSRMSNRDLRKLYWRLVGQLAI